MKQRIEWIDYAKGMAMAMVVFGHCGPSLFFNGVFYIHLPVFIMLSGYLLSASSSGDPGKGIIKKLKGIMWPYLTFGILRMVFDLIVSLCTSEVFSLRTELIWIFLWENNSNWFLPPLFFSAVVYLLLNRGGKCGVLGHCAACVCAFLVIHITKMIIYTPESILPGQLLNVFSPFYVKQNVSLLGRTAIFFVFSELGTLVVPAVEKIRTYLPERRKLPVFAAASVLFALCFLLANANGLNDIHLLLWQNGFIFFALASVGSSLFILLFSLIPFKIRVLKYIGQNTLVINGTHLAFRIPNYFLLLLSYLPFRMRATLLTSSAALLTLAVECLVIVPIFRTYLSPLVQFDRFAGLFQKCNKTCPEKQKMT